MVAIPYDFVASYADFPVESGVDSEGFPWVMDMGHKLFGKKRMGKERFVTYYKELLSEQDVRSPHCYITNAQREPGDDDVIFDCGAAEGFFALRYIEKVSEVILFECDPEWIIPLKKSFSPWQDKVHIVEKFVSDTTNQTAISLDDYISSKNLKDRKIYIKADIEGAEVQLLNGLKDSHDSVQRILICAYHKRADEKNIRKTLKAYGFSTEVNEGWMLYPVSAHDFLRPYVRRGIVYGSRT